MESYDRETIQMVMHHMPLFHQVIGADFRDLFRDYPDINQTHMKSLMFLKINGETTMTRLSHLLRLEKGSVTTIADRLVKWGLVIRLTDPEDRRRSFLRLTENGRLLAESVRVAQSAHFQERIGRLDDEERQQFFSSLWTLERLLKKMADPDELRRFFHASEEECPHHKKHEPDEMPTEKHEPDEMPTEKHEPDEMPTEKHAPDEMPTEKHAPDELPGEKHAPNEMPTEKHAPDAAPGIDRTPNPDTKLITAGGTTHA